VRYRYVLYPVVRTWVHLGIISRIVQGALNEARLLPGPKRRVNTGNAASSIPAPLRFESLRNKRRKKGVHSDRLLRNMHSGDSNTGMQDTKVSL